jgi:scyllo-inositol 2-dehydrogenase (NADP+)
VSAVNDLNVGLIGYGVAGRVFHAPLIGSVDGLRLRTIVSRRGDEARQRYPEVRIVAGADALLADDRIDLVVVASPNSTHFDLASRSLLAGKHVVVDKPFTVRSVEAARLIEISGGRPQILTVFHNRRWDGDFLTVRMLLEQKALGRLVSFESRFDRFRNTERPDAWRERSEAGSGILYDLGSHLIDQTLALFGHPLRITADVRRERDFAVTDDAFDLWMHYPKMKATLGAGMLVRERVPRFVLRGTVGTFVKYGLDPQEGALASGRTPRDADWGREPPEDWGVLISDGGEKSIETLPGRYQSFYENLRDAIAGPTALAVTAQEAAATIRLVELGFQQLS